MAAKKKKTQQMSMIEQAAYNRTRVTRSAKAKLEPEGAKPAIPARAPAPAKKADDVPIANNKKPIVKEIVLIEAPYCFGPRWAQPSSLASKLPPSVQKHIMSYLGPAQQRILGSLSIDLYSTYKAHFHTKEILISWTKDNMESAADNPLVTKAYIDAIHRWILPPHIETAGLAVQDNRKMMGNYFPNLLIQLRNRIIDKILEERQEIQELEKEWRNKERKRMIRIKLARKTSVRKGISEKTKQKALDAIKELEDAVTPRPEVVRKKVDYMEVEKIKSYVGYIKI